MKNYLAGSVLVASVLVAGCASSANLNKLQIGMSRSEVLSILGTPDSTSAQGNVEYLTYYLVANDGYGRDQPYLVRIVDGKVESFGRFAQLYDLYNRPVTGATGTTTGTPPAMYGAAPAAATPAPNDVASQLERLKQLHDQGILSDDEFAKAKAKVLGTSQ